MLWREQVIDGCSLRGETGCCCVFWCVFAMTSEVQLVIVVLAGWMMAVLSLCARHLAHTYRNSSFLRSFVSNESNVCLSFAFREIEGVP